MAAEANVEIHGANGEEGSIAADFELAGLRASPGEVVKGHLGHLELADGTRVGVPVVIVNGVEDGPTLAVTGSVHGSEVNGTGALLRTVRGLDPARMRGRLVAIPSANPFAFQVGSYYTPFIMQHDGLNLGAVEMWPGNPRGRLTEQIGACIGEALKAATHSIDVHSNPDPSITFTIAFRSLAPNDGVRCEVDRMAEASGFTVIEESGAGATGVSGSSLANAVPSIMIELTGDLFLREDNTRAGQIAITNVMKAIGILEGDLEQHAVSALQGDFVAAGRLTTSRGGLMWVRAAPGKLLKEGDVVVEIMDVWGDIVEHITMPLDGYIWAFTGGVATSHAVAQGAGVAYLFCDRGMKS